MSEPETTNPVYYLCTGDVAVILKRNYRNSSESEFEPQSLVTIKKATAKILEVGYHKFNRHGMPANRFAQGYRLSCDPQIIAALQARDKELDAIRESQKQKIQERDNRITYQLASEIVNQCEPGQTIERLEKLGETRLRELITEIAKANQ